ncbi:MAG TPA: hypothetical protein VFU47_12135, partial [Armatimonadota bacterium]|nr:hypothetical protein [Armatimonadota bacterium]
QGFTAVQFKDGGLSPDDTGSVSISKEMAKSGTGALAYSYKVEPGAVRALLAEAHIPAGTRAVRFWVRSSTPTVLMLSLRAGAPGYNLPYYVPANEWTQIAANLNEFEPEGDAAGAAALKPDEVTSIGVTDMATMLVNAPGDLAKLLPNLQGSRTVWLDDLQFSETAVPQTTGSARSGNDGAFVVDNFETPLVRWTPVRAVFGGAAPQFDLFTPEASVRVVPEAAGPGMARTPVEPGGKGLRMSYKRHAQEVFGFIRSLEKYDLSKADRLRLSLNCSQKSLVIVQLKEKDGSEYQHLVMPDNSVGWQDLNLALTDFTLSDNGKDENNRLDPDQLKELTILDGSAFAGMGDADVTLDLDAVYFVLK